MAHSSPTITLDQLKKGSVPENISFDDTINISHQILKLDTHSELVKTEMLKQVISKLVHTKTGGRGFLATYLTYDKPLPAHLRPSILEALRSQPEIVSDLVVKNLAMSSAMCIVHQRDGNQDHLHGSQQVQKRSIDLICDLDCREVSTKLSAMANTIEGTSNEYGSFFKQWKYNAEQLTEIRSVILPLL